MVQSEWQHDKIIKQKCVHDEILALLDCLTLEHETDMLSRNVGNEVPVCAALRHRRAKIVLTPQRKPEITEQ
jgi:hypothetical protein